MNPPNTFVLPAETVFAVLEAPPTATEVQDALSSTSVDETETVTTVLAAATVTTVEESV